MNTELVGVKKDQDLGYVMICIHFIHCAITYVTQHVLIGRKDVFIPE